MCWNNRTHVEEYFPIIRFNIGPRWRVKPNYFSFALFLFFLDVWITMFRLSKNKIIIKAFVCQGLLVYWDVVVEYLMIWRSIWDFGRSLIIFCGRFECLWMYIGSSLGFLYGLYVFCLISKRTSEKSTLVKLILHAIDRPYIL